MNCFLSIVIGAIISVMVLFNGTLSDAFGNYTAAILIHITGLIVLIPVLLVGKTRFKADRTVPVYLYSAGAVGVFSVLFTNISYMELGVSLTLALGLFGQSVISIVIDHFGLLEMKVIRFDRKKLIGLFLIIIGIIVMI